jgi:hypothetical protein
MTTHVLGHHGDDSAFSTGASGTARAVKECLVLFWWIGVNDECNVVYVNAASSNVGSNKCVDFSA